MAKKCEGELACAGSGGAWAAVKPATDRLGDGIERGGVRVVVLFARGLRGLSLQVRASTSGARGVMMPPAAGFVGGLRRSGLLVVLFIAVEPMPSGFGGLFGADTLSVLGGSGGKRASAGQQDRAQK